MANNKISTMTAAGTLTGDELVEVSKLSATVTITAATISAAAADNSYNDSGGGFITAGFAVGQQVKVTGFTGDTANNIFSAKITALTASKMTIGGTDGDVIVDDAAGESVTITKWETKRTTVADIAAEYVEDEWIEIACGDETTPLSVGTAKVTFHWPFSGGIQEIWAGLTTVQSSGSIFTADVNNNGSTSLSTKITIDNGEETSLTAATPPALTNTAVTKGQKGTVDIDQVGDGTATGLKIYIRVRK